MQVKTEPLIKSEIVVKEEDREKKKADILDLTGEGEFVLPSRKIGDTIVIEDD